MKIAQNACENTGCMRKYMHTFVGLYKNSKDHCSGQKKVRMGNMRREIAAGARGSNRKGVMLMKKRIGKFLVALVVTLTCLVGSSQAQRATEVSAATASDVATTAAAIAGRTGCLLADTQTVVLSLASATVPVTDDGILYVFALAPFQYTLSGTPIAQAPATANPMTAFALPDNGIYYKYVFAAKQGGAWKMLSDAQYITNPEVLATATKPFRQIPAKSWQGLADKVFFNWFMDLPNGGATANTQVLQLMNSGKDPDLIHPSVYSDTYPMNKYYYMLNCSNWTGVLKVSQNVHNIAATTQTQDFIVGNEANIREWNYTGYLGNEGYIRAYAETVRVVYNAVKSANANARVFICIDQNWNRPTNLYSAYEQHGYINGKEFITTFNNLISKEGNIDWGLAIHPHTVPLTWGKFWSYSGNPYAGVYQNMIKNDYMVGFNNVTVVTNFMQSATLLNTKGQVRPIIASEIAVSASQGEAVQAAAMYASFYAITTNPYIEGAIYYGEYNPAAGLNSVLTPKAQEVFNNMGGPNNAAYDAYARSVIGISSWGQVLR